MTVTGAPMFTAPLLSMPTLPSLSLSDDEASLASRLAMRLFTIRPQLELTGYYYDGMQKMQDLGISIPPQLRGLRTVVGWPAIGIDALVNRCIVEGFRYPGATDVDEDLMGIWQANNLDAEAPMAHLDALVYGRAYGIVGPGDENTFGQPLVTFESPLNMVAIWDARTRRVTAAFQLYLDTSFVSDTFGNEVAAIYLPDKTIHLARQSLSGGTVAPSQWQVTERDDHGLGFVPVTRLANRQRLQNRQGVSEIRPSWRNTVDSACRTLLGMEVGREFFMAPRRYALGVTEEAFQNSDGSSKSAWDTYLHKVWMLERDENGDLPQVGEFAAHDPSGTTRIFDTYASIMCGEMGLPAHMLGIHSDGNPASADAIRAGYEELTSRSEMKQLTFSDGHEDLMRMAMLVRDGSVPENAHRMETDWREAAPSTPAGTSDAITKQITVGAVPATSDVTLKRLGYSAVERQRLAQDRDNDEGAQFLLEVAHNITAKAARTDQGLAKDLENTPTGPGAGSPAAAGAPTPKDVFGGKSA